MSNVPYSITENSISLTFLDDFTQHVIPSSHVSYAKIRRALLTGKATAAKLRPLIDIRPAIESFSSGNIVVADGRLFYKGFEVKSALASLIIQFAKENNREAARPFELFLEKAFDNPDPRAASDLYDWVVRSNLPITVNGNILAWKAVREDYGSMYGNPPLERFDHHPGNVVSEDRMLCDPDPNKTCSRGLHFCSADYLGSYRGGGARVVALEVSPTDVVAFPQDAGGAKGRAWKYTVVGEVPLEQASQFYSGLSRVYRNQKPEVKVEQAATSTGPLREANGRFTKRS